MLTQQDIIKLKNIFVTKDEFLTRFDALMFELKAIREELAIVVYRQVDHTDQLEHHEQRISTLENPS